MSQSDNSTHGRCLNVIAHKGIKEKADEDIKTLAHDMAITQNYKTLDLYGNLNASYAFDSDNSVGSRITYSCNPKDK